MPNYEPLRRAVARVFLFALKENSKPMVVLIRVRYRELQIHSIIMTIRMVHLFSPKFAVELKTLGPISREPAPKPVHHMSLNFVNLRHWIVVGEHYKQADNQFRQKL